MEFSSKKFISSNLKVLRIISFLIMFTNSRRLFMASSKPHGRVMNGSQHIFWIKVSFEDKLTGLYSSATKVSKIWLLKSMLMISFSVLLLMLKHMHFSRTWNKSLRWVWLESWLISWDFKLNKPAKESMFHNSSMLKLLSKDLAWTAKVMLALPWVQVSSWFLIWLATLLIKPCTEVWSVAFYISPLVDRI